MKGFLSLFLIAIELSFPINVNKRRSLEHFYFLKDPLNVVSVN